MGFLVIVDAERAERILKKKNLKNGQHLTHGNDNLMRDLAHLHGSVFSYRNNKLVGSNKMMKKNRVNYSEK